MYSSMTSIGEVPSGENPSNCSGIVRVVRIGITIHVFVCLLVLLLFFFYFLLSVLFFCSLFTNRMEVERHMVTRGEATTLNRRNVLVKICLEIWQKPLQMKTAADSTVVQHSFIYFPWKLTLTHLNLIKERFCHAVQYAIVVKTTIFILLQLFHAFFLTKFLLLHVKK